MDRKRVAKVVLTRLALHRRHLRPPLPLRFGPLHPHQLSTMLGMPRFLSVLSSFLVLYNKY